MISIASYRPFLQTFMQEYLQEQKQKFAHVNGWGKDVFERLGECATRGKLWRGSLVMLGAEMAGCKILDWPIKIAAALEFFHTGLLIQDDIMDQDMMRRGEPTMYTQYQRLGESMGARNPLHFGISQAISVGDVVFFLAHQLLGDFPVEHAAHAKQIIGFFAEELIKIGFGQMEDVSAGQVKKLLTEEEIISIYRHKTARYTFSLPLMVGSWCAGRYDLGEKLEKFGEALGILFQLKDDEMGLFGKTEEIGKPVGSDIREGKQTLFYYHLFAKVTKEERSQLETIFGHEIDESKLGLVRNLIFKYNIADLVQCKLELCRDEALKILENLELEDDYKTLLRDMVEQNMQRKQ